MAEDKEFLKRKITLTTMLLTDEDKKQIRETFSDKELKEMKEVLETQTLDGRVKALQKEILGLELSRDDTGLFSLDKKENEKLHYELKKAEARLSSLHSSADPTKLASIEEIKKEYYDSKDKHDELFRYYNNYLVGYDSPESFERKIQEGKEKGYDTSFYATKKDKMIAARAESIVKLKELTGLDVRTDDEHEIRKICANYDNKAGAYEVRLEVIRAEEALQFVSDLIEEKKNPKQKETSKETLDERDSTLNSVAEKLGNEASYGELQEMKKELEGLTFEAQLLHLNEEALRVDGGATAENTESKRIIEIANELSEVDFNVVAEKYSKAKSDYENALAYYQEYNQEGIGDLDSIIAAVESYKDNEMSREHKDEYIADIKQRKDKENEEKAKKAQEFKALTGVDITDKASAEKKLSELRDEYQASMGPDNIYANAVEAKSLLSKIAQKEQELVKNNKEAAKDYIEGTKKEKTSDDELDQLRNKFLQGVDDFTQEEAIRFLDAFYKGAENGGLNVSMSPENTEKMANLIHKIPDTGDEKFLSHWRVTIVTHSNRYISTQIMNRAAKKIKKKQEEYAKKICEEEIKLYGEVRSYNEDNQLVKAIKEKTTTKAVETADLAKDKGYFARKSALKKEKKSYEKATIKSLQKRREELTKKLEKLNEYREEIQNKTVRTKEEVAKLKELQKDIQSYSSLSNTLEAMIKNRTKSAEDKIAEIEKDFQEAIAPHKKTVKDCFQYITEKTSILAQSTTKGKYLHKLLNTNNLTPDQRKKLEDLANGYTQEKLKNDAEYKNYIKKKVQAAGIFNPVVNDDGSELLAEILKEETGHITYNSVQKQPEENTDTLQENTDTAGYDGQPQTQAQAQAEEQDRKERDAALNEETDQAQAEADAEEKKEEIEKEIEGQKEEAKKTDRVIINEGEVEEQINTQVRDFTSAFTDHSAFSGVDYEVSKTDIANTLVFKDKKDEHEFKIEHSEENRYNLSAKSKDGENKVPSVDDMRSMLQALKQEGHDSVDLGTVKNPEFLANMIVAAEEAGIKIDNREEIEKKIREQGKGEDLEIAIYKAKKSRKVKDSEYKELADRIGYTQETTKEPEQVQEEQGKPEGQQKGKDDTDKNKSNEPSEKQIDETKTSLDALAKIDGMNSDEYDKYKGNEEYKSLSSKQQKMLDTIHGLQEAKKLGKLNSSDSRYYQLIGKVVGDYKRISERTKGRDKSGDKIKRKYAEKVATNLAKAQGGR